MKETPKRTIMLELTEEECKILDNLSELSGWSQQHILKATIWNYLSRWLRVYEKRYRISFGMEPYTNKPISDSERRAYWFGESNGTEKNDDITKNNS